MADGVVRLTAPVHRIAIRHCIGALRIESGFTLTKPWTVLFGPSGSGKSTILRAIAGLIRPDDGRIVSTAMPGTQLEREFTLLDTKAGVFVPAHRRVIRYAPQQASLFPHLTVRGNLIYGFPKMGSHGDLSEWEMQVTRALEAFDLVTLAEKLPTELSGGEAQRVNLARAHLALGCRLLLLDEPFTGFDTARRTRTLGYLKEHAVREHKPILSVTHDVAEAFEVGAEVIKIHDGRVIAQGPVHEVLREERLNLLRQIGADELPRRSAEPYLGG